MNIARLIDAAAAWLEAQTQIAESKAKKVELAARRMELKWEKEELEYQEEKARHAAAAANPDLTPAPTLPGVKVPGTAGDPTPPNIAEPEPSQVEIKTPFETATIVTDKAPTGLAPVDVVVKQVSADPVANMSLATLQAEIDRLAPITGVVRVPKQRTSTLVELLKKSLQIELELKDSGAAGVATPEVEVEDELPDMTPEQLAAAQKDMKLPPSPEMVRNALSTQVVRPVYAQALKLGKTEAEAGVAANQAVVDILMEVAGVETVSEVPEDKLQELVDAANA